MNNTTALPAFANSRNAAFSGSPAFGASSFSAFSSAATASSPTSSAAALDTLQSRFALRVASRLSEGAESIGPDISERLRFAREQALERARAARTVASPAEADARMGITAGGAAIRGRSGGGAGWWMKLAAIVPVFALIGGLVLIERWQDNAQIATAAEIDAALLSDDLPPTAYSDAGFVEFLKTPSQ